jgi:hypothetical protein
MAGMGSIYATVEMNQRAEVMILKVRNELLRSGSTPDTFSVERQGTFLQMTYRNQTICTDPYEVWIVLRKMSSGLDDSEIWARLSTVRQLQTQTSPKAGWGIGLLVAGLILAFVLLVGSRF